MSLLLAGLLLAAFTVLLTVFTVRMARRFNFGEDRRKGVQRAHRHWAPRLGGLPIFVALIAWMAYTPSLNFWTWMLCLTPAFAAGLAEDLTHRVGPWPRLALTMIGAGLAWFFLRAHVERLGPEILDSLLLSVPSLSFCITLLFVGGVAHALNIIDGYNGLASSYAMVVLGAVLIVALRVNDAQIAWLAGGAMAACAGFFVLNFPYGRIFLGDGGSYLLGTVIAFLLVILSHRHAEISPMFAALLLVYPVWETLFSMYRRRVLRGAPTMQPDAVHLHTLVHKRLVRSNDSDHGEIMRVLMNSATTLYALAMSSACAGAAILFWDNGPALFMVFGSFIAGYMALYTSLVRFRAPRRLSVRRKWDPATARKRGETGPKRRVKASPST